jgi:hypothetical protein
MTNPEEQARKIIDAKLAEARQLEGRTPKGLGFDV